jgi:ribosome modulation factor
MNNIIRKKVKGGPTRQRDESSRTIVYVMSSGTSDDPVIDRDGEAVDVEGVTWENWARAGFPVCHNHETDKPSIGNLVGEPWLSWIGAGTDYPELGGEKRRALMGRVHFSEHNPLAEQLYQQALEGTFTGSSISFVPTSPPGRTRGGNTLYRNSEIVEFSLASIGANPDSVRTRKKHCRTGANPPRGRADEVSDEIAVRARDLMSKGVEMDDAIDCAMEEMGCPRTARPAVKQLTRKKCHEHDLAFMKDLSPQVMDEVHRAYIEGFTAGENGERPEDGPYQIGSPLANAGWQAGYRDQQDGKEPAVRKHGDDPRWLSRADYDPDAAGEAMVMPIDRWSEDLTEDDLEKVLSKMDQLEAGYNRIAGSIARSLALDEPGFEIFAERTAARRRR